MIIIIIIITFTLQLQSQTFSLASDWIYFMSTGFWLTETFFIFSNMYYLMTLLCYGNIYLPVEFSRAIRVKILVKRDFSLPFFIFSSYAAVDISFELEWFELKAVWLFCFHRQLTVLEGSINRVFSVFW